VHACGSDPSQPPLTENLPGHNATACQTSSLTGEGQSPLMTLACTQMAYGWALGGSPVALPSVAGFPIGGTDSRYIVVEIHVSNPNYTNGLVGPPLTGGVRLRTTTTFRANNATTLQLGDVAIQAFDHNPTYAIGTSQFNKEIRAIPSGQPSRPYAGSCPSKCTTLLKGPLTASNSFLHMHASGRTVFTTKTSSGGSPQVMSQIANWNFGFQIQVPVNYVVTPGDSLSTHCIYDTSKYSTGPTWGPTSSNEMCLFFSSAQKPSASWETNVVVFSLRRHGFRYCLSKGEHSGFSSLWCFIR